MKAKVIIYFTLECDFYHISYSTLITFSICGGDISLLAIEEDKFVKVQLEGACISCSVNQMTLKSGVEMTIKKYAPQIEKVINVE